jgi:hypothetical protein
MADCKLKDGQDWQSANGSVIFVLLEVRINILGGAPAHSRMFLSPDMLKVSI